MIDEDLVDRHSEEFRQAQCQREARIVFVGFDTIDGLARDAKAPRKFTLTPFALFAEML
jgi:hypothetical protein